MFDYLQQFNNLPKDLRDQVSSPSAMAVLTELEDKYQVDLAMVVMKIMIKSVRPRDFVAYFMSEFSLTPEQAANLSRELQDKIFSSVADYLGLAIEQRALDLNKDINLLIKEAGLVLPSELLVNRFKTVLTTYLKGIRNKIDTRATLAKEINQGGLQLSLVEIDRVLKVCNTHKFANLDSSVAPLPPVSRLDKIINQAEKLSGGEYDLKKSLAQKSASAPNISPFLNAKNELSAPEEQLDLPAGHKVLDLPAAAPQNSPSPAPVPARPQPAASQPTPEGKPAVGPILSNLAATAATALAVSSSLPKTAASLGVSVLLNNSQKIIQPVKKAGLFANFLKKKHDNPAGKTSQPPVVPAAPASSPQGSISRPSAVKSSTTTPPVASVPNATIAQPSPHLATAAIRPAQTNSSRPQLHDIKPLPKVMGPIEELQFLDLVNFRRLGKTPAEITARIFSKIKLLEKDGYDKMVAGVKAWRQSPVNRLYLRIGQEAIAKGLPLKASAEARAKDHQETLSWEELEAIVSLNGRLVF